MPFVCRANIKPALCYNEPLMDKINSSSHWLTRFFFQKTFGFIYFIAFLSTAQQFRGLIGEHGLLPMRLYLKHIQFWDSPSLFWFNASDFFVSLIVWFGVGLSLLAVSGISERFGIYFSTAVWTLLWIFYLSVVNVGQVFYGFGWETMTLEVGFLAIFLGSADTKSPAIAIWFLRWVLFRLMFGAGLIKMRGDACWRDLTCMFYHYQTQPIPNPLSWYFHHLPHGFLKFQTLYTYFIELVVPWFYFIPGPLGWTAGVLTIAFQGCLILSGNLSWLNYLTIVIAIACFDDTFLGKWARIIIPETTPPKKLRKWILTIFSALILYFSINPASNLFSTNQLMNASFESFHLVNTYGAFGSVTKDRTEVIFEGADDWEITAKTTWREYEFKAKPGDVHRRPPLIAPYHLRLDWLMWFAAMSNWRYHPWIINLVNKLLQNDPEILKQIDKNPFPNHPPHYIRAVLYSYRFTDAKEKNKTGDWWIRKPLGLYLPPISLDNEAFRKILHEESWA